MTSLLDALGNCTLELGGGLLGKQGPRGIYNDQTDYRGKVNLSYPYFSSANGKSGA